MRRIASHLTYANVMATIAVFIALGGGAYAVTKKAPPNSVNSKAVIDGQVKSQDIAIDSIGNDQVGYHALGTGTLQDGLISGVKLAPINSVSKSVKIDEGGFDDITISCPGPQDVLISGGANINPQNTGTALQASFRINKNTWYARGTNPSAEHTATLQVFADCLGPIA